MARHKSSQTAAVRGSKRIEEQKLASVILARRLDACGMLLVLQFKRRRDAFYKVPKTVT